MGGDCLDWFGVDEAAALSFGVGDEGLPMNDATRSDAEMPRPCTLWAS